MEQISIIMARKGAHVVTKPRRNDTPEKMIRRFVRKVKKVGVIQEVKKRKYYEKPSVTRRRKQIDRKRVLERLKEKKSTNYRSKR